MYDLLVIGWGKGGKTLATKYSKMGFKVAIIEEERFMAGGTCINVGCLPSKFLSHRAKILNKIREYGIEFDKDKAFLEASRNKKDMVKKLNIKNFDLLDKNDNVDIYFGKATFLSNYEVKVNDKTLLAKSIVINTGSKPKTMGIFNTSKEILNLEKLPKKLLIIGAGFIGLEFATTFSNFGSEVTVWQNDDNFMPSEDEDSSQFIKETLIKKGIKFNYNKEKVELTGYDEILVSIGRIPNTENLGLENTDIKIGENGEILVDEYLRTGVPNIYAVGDVKGGPQFTYISLDDSRIVLEQLLDKKPNRSIKDRKNIPITAFLDPPYSRVGYNEKMAKLENIEYEVKYMPSIAIPKSHVIEELEGFTKILVDKKGCVIGATIFNYESHEMINLISLGIKKGIKYDELKDFIFTHPTFSESLNDI